MANLSITHKFTQVPNIHLYWEPRTCPAHSWSTSLSFFSPPFLQLKRLLLTLNICRMQWVFELKSVIFYTFLYCYEELYISQKIKEVVIYSYSLPPPPPPSLRILLRQMLGYKINKFKQIWKWFFEMRQNRVLRSREQVLVSCMHLWFGFFILFHHKPKPAWNSSRRSRRKSYSKTTMFIMQLEGFEEVTKFLSGSFYLLKLSWQTI